MLASHHLAQYWLVIISQMLASRHLIQFYLLIIIGHNTLPARCLVVILTGGVLLHPPNQTSGHIILACGCVVAHCILLILSYAAAYHTTPPIPAVNAAAGPGLQDAHQREGQCAGTECAASICGSVHVITSATARQCGARNRFICISHHRVLTAT